MPSKPNLFIIGAMKSGTTSLHNYLNLHPDIAMSDEKEPGYFVEELGLSKGEQWYLSLFDDGAGCKYQGESSTHYTKLPLYAGVPDRILKFNQASKLIYIMRDPFERMISHYWHAVRAIHHGGETLSLLKAVHEKPEYLAFSHYAMQLKPYFDLFGKEAVYTLTFESLLRDPNKEVNRIFQWLELPNHEISQEAKEAHNQKPERFIGVAGTGLLNRIQYSEIWDRTSQYVPQKLKNWAKRIAYKDIDETEARKELAALKKSVAEQQLRQIKELSLLLNREFPEWSRE